MCFQQAAHGALLQLDDQDPASKASNIAEIKKYAKRFDLGLIQVNSVPHKRESLKGTSTYSFIVCPDGFSKLSENEVASSCADLNLTCPAGS
ncbi:hypothetical protein GUITHDRAFT_101351 [Guillardia theta CCMP2712]|uniref:Uncharacterized protein n=1 Tax=Guillardia theta (strain CCMP2712) TaxID=905079 RepID=L1JWF6_GUITC|nr:hypothetical protein GUITHDRAFT_101351 [Guillardia theta CCMP2712]EKX52901.1 hypothetical protein GUITHDRAFT_101351 [Guillardia theta CCMP2712]|eukprot:XP_005839881.1 hypothetical protein GUITHDRAFT_101351 [Guillardia theta CCMP2712]